jgi:hypothetical protein
LKKTIANKGKRPTTLTRSAVKRIGRAVNAYERGDRDVPGRKFRRFGAGGDGEDGDTVRLGKTTGAWNKGTLATITLYEGGVPPAETASSPAETLAQCVNKFSNVESDKWVIVALAGNNAWYLIAAEC